MMFKKSLLGTMISVAVTSSVISTSAIAADRSLLKLDSSEANVEVAKSRVIVQLRGIPAAARMSAKANRMSGEKAKKYNAFSRESTEYRKQLRRTHHEVMQSIGLKKATYHYEHSFNGFAAELSPTQIEKLRAHGAVVKVWNDELNKIDTANTPAFLELTAPGGLHNMNIKGEDVIIGIIDSGVWPENPSLDDEGYDPIALTRPDWAGECDTGTDPDFQCNNKLIGARYFNEAFAANLEILEGEFDSPRDAGGHGTHVMTTAAGNENTDAVLQGVDAGTVTGMAPRARTAMYKVCWNGSTPGNSGCFSSDSVAAIDAAVADGVDILNYSISGSTTELTDIVHAAFLNAAKGGIYSAISAGNSGPGPETVAHNVPWVTTVGASTYDGEMFVVGNEMEVTVDGQASDSVFSIPSAISPAYPESGFAGELVAAVPAEACGAGAGLENGADIAGKIALIARGTCAFSEKILNAQAEGAVGVVVYSDDRTPTAMGGDATGISIPGVMITNGDGLDIVSTMDTSTVSVNFTYTAATATEMQVGNMMAGFSSRGASGSVADLIKPDITAPGVSIFAGTSGAQVDSGVMGESYQYMSGTSMSSPHMAGLAALVKEVHPDWSPAAVKSAFMTSAYQGVTKEDGVTAADPFDFGAGHVDPNQAINPGLIYDAGIYDYYAFLCGSGEDAYVEAEAGAGICQALVDAGYSLDPSDLNLASIGIAELGDAQTVTRIVRNVAGTEAFDATIEAPAGINVEVSVFDFGTGTFVPSTTMNFNADGIGAYQLTFSHGDGAELDAWSFGSISWTDGAHVARSPIAIRATLPPVLSAPESLAFSADKPRLITNFSVDTFYKGTLRARAIGMNDANVMVATVEQDPDSSYEFNEPGLALFFADVPEGTRIADFSLRTKDLPDAAMDLDMYVYSCEAWYCAMVGSSAMAASDESVTLVDPMPLADLDNGNTYVIFVHGWSLNGADAVDASLRVSTADEMTNSDRVYTRADRIATEGGESNVSLRIRGLAAGESYVGGVIYKNQHDEEIGMSVLKVDADFQGRRQR